MPTRRVWSYMISAAVMICIACKSKHNGTDSLSGEPVVRVIFSLSVLFLTLIACNGSLLAQDVPKKQFTQIRFPKLSQLRDSVLAKADSLLAEGKKWKERNAKLIQEDSGKLKNYLTIRPSSDSVSLNRDSVTSALNAILSSQKESVFSGIGRLRVDSNWKQQLKALQLVDTSIISTVIDPFQKLSAKPPLLQWRGGYATYNFSYQSNIDTPYIEKDLTQHQLVVSGGLTVAGIIPLRVNAFLRRSNSSLFQNINDVQVVFDPGGYRNILQGKMKQHLLSQMMQKKDSLLKSLGELDQLITQKLESAFKEAFSLSDIANARELLRVPQVSYDMSLPESVNQHRADSLQRAARVFLQTYDKVKGQYDALLQAVDSLRGLYNDKLKRLKTLERSIEGKVDGFSATDLAIEKVRDIIPTDSLQVPPKYRWLMGIRNFGLGRSVVNSSELTTRNVSLTGVNFEYNSWYYLAVTAGMVDYRFRDFVVGKQQKTPQYLYQLRLGVGKLERNYFIVSFFHGQKQLFASTSNSSGVTSIKVSGISAESKWQINRNIYVIGEIAQSVAPDYRSNPPKSANWKLGDSTNKAYAGRLYAYFPKTATRIEGQYKFTGANYQSFNSFQTNAATTSWWIRADQRFFKRRLGITASLRKNDFSNPYIQQRYETNSVYKSINANYHPRKGPTVSVGYMPMSQLTVLDDRIIENQFQTLNVSLIHFYSLGTQKLATNVVYTQFYNSGSDTGFVYYNASNFFLCQTIFFRRFSSNINVTFSKSPNYEFNVLEENFTIPLGRWGSAGGGVKINNLNRLVTKVGGFITGTIVVHNDDVITLYLENGYLPGIGNELRRNGQGNISFTKSF